MLDGVAELPDTRTALQTDVKQTYLPHTKQDQEREDWPHLLGGPLLRGLLLHGVLVGRVRLPHQPHPHARLRPHGQRQILAQVI